MAASPPAAPARKPGSFLNIVLFVAMFYIILQPKIRNAMGEGLDKVLGPVIGFDGRYPVLTIMIAGALMVLFTTAVRHFTTDWLDMAKNQAFMREFQKEFSKARKENNTYRIKKLTEKQPEVMQKQSEMSSKQLKTMPYTMIIVVPLFAWLFHFLTATVDYTFYSNPWNPNVDMFSTNVFPNWILLYMTLSIPVGALVQKSMKYLSWKERWQDRHPDVHE